MKKLLFLSIISLFFGLCSAASKGPYTATFELSENAANRLRQAIIDNPGAKLGLCDIGIYPGDAEALFANAPIVEFDENTMTFAASLNLGGGVKIGIFNTKRIEEQKESKDSTNMDTDDQ